MPSNILWAQPSGLLAVTGLFDDSDPAEHAAMLLERGDVPADWVVAGLNVEWPDTGWPHEAHRFTDGAVVVDFAAAVEVTKGRLRQEREPLFAVNDLLLRDAMVEGDAAKKAAGLAERDRLRALPELADAAKSLEELKSLKGE